MTLFSNQMHADLTRSFADLVGAKRGTFECGRFGNGELFVRLSEPVEDERCAVVGTLAPPENNLAEYTLLCHTLLKNGSSEVIAITPYLAYSRQDRFEAGFSLASGWLGNLLRSSGVSHLYTIDLHSPEAALQMPVHVHNLSPDPIFQDEVGPMLADGWTLVAPDEGAIARCLSLGMASGASFQFCNFHKVRRPEGVYSVLVGETSSRAVIFDDILDTGETLLACCEGLEKAGAHQIRIIATHGLFTGERWRNLFDRSVEEVLISDSVLPLRAHHPRVRVASCAQAMAHEGQLQEKKENVEA